MLSARVGLLYTTGGKATHAGDMAKGGWAGAYTKNIPDNHYPGGTAMAIACKSLKHA